MSSHSLSDLPLYNISVGQIPSCPCHAPSSSASHSCPSNTPPGTPPGHAIQPGAETPQGSRNPHEDSIPVGYPTLANRMSVYPEIAVFRRFESLSSQNLLYLQAELLDMEQDLRDLQIRDGNSPTDAKLFSVNWWYMAHAKERGANPEQWELVQKIRKKLNEYNKAIIQQHHILRMPPPGQKDLTYLQEFLETDEMGPLALTGDDSSICGHLDKPQSHSADLVALLPRENEDPFSTWVTERAVFKLMGLKFLQSQELAEVRGLQGCKDSTLTHIAGMVTSVVASALPILSIVVLYFVQSLEARIGVIAAFNLILSICMAVFTKAKRAEIFAVSAAFAAVQVVFVQVGTDGA